MPNETIEGQVSRLIEAVDKLAHTTEQVASSLLKLELLCIEMLKKQEEDRIEAKERTKKYDEESEAFKIRQKEWTEEDKKWREANKNPWTSPTEIGSLLLMAAFLIAVSAMATTIGILANR